MTSIPVQKGSLLPGNPIVTGKMLPKRYPLGTQGGMLLLVTIMVLLSSLSLSWYIPRANLSLQREKEARLRRTLHRIRSAISRFEQRNDCFPDSIQNLLRDDQGRPFLRRVYQDPVTGKREWLWQKSATGVEVHSLSKESSLTGTAYSSW